MRPKSLGLNAHTGCDGILWKIMTIFKADDEFYGLMDAMGDELESL